VQICEDLLNFRIFLQREKPWTGEEEGEEAVPMRGSPEHGRRR
jgi:hypothetical protein